MQVILLERVGRLGTIGDEVAVKDGFARNFLLPQGKAIRANESNRVRFESERAVIEKRNADKREAAAGIAEGINGASVIVIRSAGENGHLYGSVSSRDISESLTSQGFEVTKTQVDLPLPIKTVGMHKVALNLHPEVEVSVNVNVARSDSEAERQAAGEDLTNINYDDEEDAAEAAAEAAAAEAAAVEASAGEDGGEAILEGDAEAEAEAIAEETERQEDA